MNNLPLSGIKVVEIAHIVAGPTAGLILGDLGAEVIKIEPPNACLLYTSPSPRD